MAIFNKHKNPFDDFIDSLNTVNLINRVKLIDKKLSNIFKLENKSIKIRLKLEKDFLSKILLKKLL